MNRPEDMDLEVFVEIPGGSRNKYEWDPAIGGFRLDRRLFSATVYPADYGYVPKTHGEDGDPLDALVLLEEPTFPGCTVSARLLGVFWMQDEAGPDAKLICVPAGDPRFPQKDLRDLPEHLLQEIEHFFDIYKTLEPGKEAETNGFDGRDAAMKELAEARKRYEDLPHKA
jgi:inorganic pyrophosphatase